MKIVYITLQFYPNAFGSGIHAYELCKELLRHGHKVIVITMGSRINYKYENLNGLEIYRVKLPFKNPYYNPLNPFIFWVYGRSILKSLDADVLIGHGFESSLFIKYSKVPIKIYKAAGTPVIQSERRPILTIEDRIGKHTLRLASKLEKDACTYADKIIAISNSIKKELITYYKINAKKVNVIYNGINLERFKQYDHKLNYFKTDSTNIIYAGRFSTIKGPQIIIRILLKVANHFNDNIKFIFIGNGPLFKYLKSFSNKFPYNKYMIVLKSVPNNIMPLIYASADLCIIPSYYEPFGLVALESLASGLPVLASNVGGLSEIFNKFDPFFLFSIENRQELINKIIEILKGKKFDLSEFRSKTRIFLQNNFTWSDNVEKTIDLINSIKKT